MSILIYTNPIHSGKTQRLLAWCAHQNNVGGILMPVVNEKRYFYNIGSNEYFLAEDESLSSAQTLQIGKYKFSRKCFDIANQLITKAIIENHRYVIIDELGFLELEKKGLYSSWQFALRAIENRKFTNTLLLVVRDSLIKNITEKMNNFNFTVVDDWI
jgi:nucleoside-triphosphatase THEP1